MREPSDQVLRLLRQHADAFLSGAELSACLGVSRTAVWKQIGVLRDAGYQIEAVPSRGYRLRQVPDRLLPAEVADGLHVRLIGRSLVYHAETDSTNSRAWQLGEEGAPAGTVVIADQQTAGKGRLGRRWCSPPGVNLYLSVLLRPDLEPRQAPQLTFMTSLAVARAVELCSGLRPTVKWPNDVLIGGRKLAGLLNEMSAETEQIHFLVLGIGVNLNMQAAQFPDDLRYPATSLAQELGAPVSRTDFCRTLLAELDRLYLEYERGGFDVLREGWLGYFDLRGRRVLVEGPQRTLLGEVTGIDHDGALLLLLDNGMLERVLAGDVRPL